MTTVGAAATVGSIYMITDTLTQTADNRLIAFQQQVYRDIRNIETDLLHKTKLLEISYRIDHSPDIPDGDINAITQLIDETLTAKNMRARFINPQFSDQAPDTTLAQMFSQARASRRNRIRFTTGLGPDPTLTLVTPILENNTVEQFILIQANLDQPYLKEIADPLGIKIAIFNINGEPLIKSHDTIDHQQLTEPLLKRILSGEKVFSSGPDQLSNRTLYNLIPLGTTDTILLSIELPTTDTANLVANFFTRAALTILATLLIGSFIFYRLISRISMPIEDIISATDAIAKGNLEYRLNEDHSGEFKYLVHSFNEMMTSLSSVHSDRIQKERELTVAREELHYKQLLEEKNREIEISNEELAAHNKELSVLLQINQEISTTLDLNKLFDKILSALKDLIECQVVILLMYNPGSEVLEVSHALGIDREALNDVTFKLNEGISGECARTKTTNYVPDLKIDKRYLSYKKTLTVFGSMLSIPLITHNKLCGVLNLHKDKINKFTADEIALSEAVASQAALAIENAQLYKLATELSITDELTGLANRRHFQDIFNREFAQTQRYSSSLSLIMIDIDYFKKYNDYHGHLQGDVVLKKVATCLLRNTRGIDLVCRFGGEEFIILLPKTTTHGAMIAAEKLRGVVETELFSGEAESQPGGKLTLSLGVSSFPGDTADFNHLLELADQALYEAKKQGRNRVLAYSDGKQKA
jgi:diguanylate cyclase (GGDEF)-like protein